jgi:hypothetical protein
MIYGENSIFSSTPFANALNPGLALNLNLSLSLLFFVLDLTIVVVLGLTLSLNLFLNHSLYSLYV